MLALSPKRIHPLFRVAAWLALAALLFGATLVAEEPPLVLLAQSLARDERSIDSYAPLAQYIASLTGRRCTLQMPPNFPAYWATLRQGKYDLALDAPHFTDYRVHKFGFSVLAKLPDAAGYSLIARDAEAPSDPAQLVGRRIASLGLLSVGAGRLAAMFPNPVRQPLLIEVASVDQAMDLLLARRVEAAFLPAPALARRLAQGGVTVVLTTEPMTQLAVSASPRLPAEMRERVREGLLRADQTEAGRALLRAIDIKRFEPVTAESFANQRTALKRYWGY
ncbi:MAG: phosphate/phosphite/phosphonate ABC transporter substrate-binding protein [Sulfurifustis sp.]